MKKEKEQRIFHIQTNSECESKRIKTQIRKLKKGVVKFAFVTKSRSTIDDDQYQFIFAIQTTNKITYKDLLSYFFEVLNETKLLERINIGFKSIKESFAIYLHDEGTIKIKMLTKEPRFIAHKETQKQIKLHYPKFISRIKKNKEKKQIFCEKNDNSELEDDKNVRQRSRSSSKSCCQLQEQLRIENNRLQSIIATFETRLSTVETQLRVFLDIPQQPTIDQQLQFQQQQQPPPLPPLVPPNSMSIMLKDKKVIFRPIYIQVDATRKESASFRNRFMEKIMKKQFGSNGFEGINYKTFETTRSIQQINWDTICGFIFITSWGTKANNDTIGFMSGFGRLTKEINSDVDLDIDLDQKQFHSRKLSSTFLQIIFFSQKSLDDTSSDNEAFRAIMKPLIFKDAWHRFFKEHYSPSPSPPPPPPPPPPPSSLSSKGRLKKENETQKR